MKSVFFILLFITFFFVSFSQQDIIKSEETVVINNKKYYLHSVESGQTLYSICKAYNVSQKDVAKANSLFSSSIKIGQILNIPIVIKELQNSPDYYWHKVVVGETLYAISKKYDVSIEDIIKHNSDSKYGLKTDQVIKIPNIKKGAFDYQDDQIYYYTVEKGNTLFSLSQRFGIPIKQIILFNPDSETGLKVGQVLKIPKTNYDISERLPIDKYNETVSNELINNKLYFENSNITPCNKFLFNKKMKFNIVLLLPLHINNNLHYLGRYIDDKDQMFYKNTQGFIEIYEGILIALNKLKTVGLSVNLSVFDTENDSKKVQSIMSELEFSDIDLIIGPVYSNNVKIAAHYAKRNRINLISLLSQRSDLIEENPFVFQVVPSVEMRIKKTSDLLSRLHDTSIVIIHNGTESEKELIDIYKNKLVQSFSFTEQTDEISLKTIDYSLSGEETIEDALSVGLENVIIIPSDEEVFVTQVIEKLYTLTENYEIKLVGSPRWENFQNINLEYLKSLSFHYISPIYINYTLPEVKRFISEYRAVYETEPSDFSFQGYDIITFFLNALKKYGRHFQFCLTPNDLLPKKEGLIFNFDFVRTNDHGGFENNGTLILEYDNNFQLKKADF